jgi:hypothetical protein
MVPNGVDDIFLGYGCSELLIKRLAPNDNSKNQVYLGGSFEILTALNFGNITTSQDGGKRDRYKASLNFSWIVDGQLKEAPFTQLILYPKYPEVRMSGFLRGCENAPNELMNSRAENRILFLSRTNSGKVLGFVSDDEQISNWFQLVDSNLKKSGVFSIYSISGISPEDVLFENLRRICSLGWLEGKRLNREGAVIPCLSSNCGGYTLEAELGIIPNGHSEPDFMGYEIKSFSYKGRTYSNSVLTLMTPEPTGGYYRQGLQKFIEVYGYPDKLGRPNRWNFGGVHRIGIRNASTNLTLVVNGYDVYRQKITDVSGAIQLIDQFDNIAAEWSFSGLIDHWARKHRKACYVPSIKKTHGNRDYYNYSSIVHLGEGTDFIRFLNSWVEKLIFYDPALKVVLVDDKVTTKKRNQFRIKFQNLSSLYFDFTEFDLSRQKM